MSGIRSYKRKPTFCLFSGVLDLRDHPVNTFMWRKEVLDHPADAS